MKKFLIGILISILLLAATAIAACTDTDGGVHFKTNGVVSGWNVEKQVVTLEDKCLSPTTISEYYCNFDDKNYPDGYIVSWVVSCPKCENGACPSSTLEEHDVFPVASCTDSDGGLNYYQHGSVTLESADKTKKSVLIDRCRPTPPEALRRELGYYPIIEYYCENGKLNSRVSKCDPDACEGGSCQPSSAISSSIKDIKETINTLKKEVESLKGRVSSLEQKYGQISTQPSEPQLPTESVTPLIIGSCVDNDGGIKATIKGTTTGPVLANKKTATYTDECVNKNKLREYFCDTSKKHQGYVNYKLEKCNCENGKCPATAITGGAIKTRGNNNWKGLKDWIKNLF